MYTYGGFSFALMQGIDYLASPVVHAVLVDARHARSEAMRFVTADCTYHRLKPGHNRDYGLQIAQTEAYT